MKSFFGVVGFVLISAIGLSATAEVSYSMPSLEAGFKWNAMDLDGGSSSKQSLGLQFGGSVVFNLAEKIGLRTGLFYNERTFKFDSVDGKVTYADVPAHLMFKLEDYAGIYFGPSLSMKIGDECKASSGSCTLQDVSGMVTPLTFGGQFKFTPNLGLNLFFETVPTTIARGLKNSRGIGANILFSFD
jgi:hypothetical protein